MASKRDLRHSDHDRTAPAVSAAVLRRAVPAAALVLAAGLISFLLVAQLAGSRAWKDAAPAGFLTQALGAPQSAAALVREPAAGVRVRVGGDDHGVAAGPDRVALGAGHPGRARWARYANGFSRPTGFGHETIVVGRGRVEQFLTVHERQGRRTWTWPLRTTLEPRLTPAGAVGFVEPRTSRVAGLVIAPLGILDANGGDVTPAGLRWSLRRSGGGWALELALDDRELPLPYVVDPAITYRSVGGATTTGATLTIAAPAGVAVDDFLVAAVGVRGGSNATITPPSGWTLALRTNNGTSIAQAVYTKVATVDDVAAGSFAWGFDTSRHGAGGILAYSGVDGSNPFDGDPVGQTGSGNTPATPSLATSAAGTVAVGFLAQAWGAAYTLSSGTGRWNLQTSGGPQSGRLSSAAGELVVATPGSAQISGSTGANAAYVAQIAGLRVDTVAPTAPSQTLAEFAADSHVVGSTLYYRPAGTGASFTVSASTGDAQSGLQKVSFPGLADGFSPTTAADDSASPYEQTYSWTSGATLSGAQTVTAYDNAGNTATGAFTVMPDSSVPAPATSFPAASSYDDAAWTAGCAAPGLCGTTAVDDGSGLASVELSIRHGSGDYYDGAGFSSASEVWLPATGTATWSYPFTGTSFPADGVYTVRVRATDNVGNAATSAVTFTYDTAAPGSAVTFPASDTDYNGSAWDLGCSTGSGDLCGTASDASGAVQTVEVSIRRGSGDYYDGAAFASETEVWLPAAGTDSWSYALPASAFPADGDYTVRVRAIDVAGNVETPTSLGFTYDATAPSNSLSLTAASPAGSSHLAGATVFYRGADAGSLTLTNAVSDATSGPASSTTSALGGTTSGWSHAPGTVSTPAGGPYESAQLAWAAGATGAPTVDVTGADAAGNTAVTGLAFRSDSTAPAGGSLTGAPAFSSSGTFALARTDYAETASATASGLASSVLTREVAALTGGTCSGYGSPTVLPGGDVSESDLATGCYRYTLTGADNVGNTASTTVVVRVDRAAPTSSVGAPAAYQTGTSFSIAYAASDEATDVDSVELWAKAPGESSYSLAATDSDASTPSFAYTAGAGDGTYVFYTRAHDAAGNYEDAPASPPDASTVVDTTPPSSSASATSWTSSTSIAVGYTASDATSGVKEVELWVKGPSDGSFALAATDTTPVTPSFAYAAAQGDGVYRFYTRARDEASHLEDAPASPPDASTTVETVFTNTAPPAISGTAAVGGTLTASGGTWSPAPASSSFQWVRCDADGASCADIAGATDTTYAPVAADEGNTLRVRETVSRAGYTSQDATSAPTAAIAAGSFTNDAPPIVSGIAEVGETLTATAGSWTPAPATSALQWLRCDAAGASCAPVAGASATTYVLQDADYGGRIRVRETVTKTAYVDGSAQSAATVAVADATAPTTTDDAPADYSNAAVTVTLTPTDSGGSGVAQTSYEVNGGATQTGTSVLVPVTDGTHTITYRSSDAAGNVEADRTATVRIDATAPATDDDAPSATADAVTVTLTATDSGGSGVVTTTYEVNGGATETGTSVAIPEVEGSYTITYRSADGAGNVEDTRTATVVVDKTAPTAAVAFPAAAAAYNAASWDAFAGSAADGLSAVTQVEVSVRRLADGFWWAGSTWTSSVTELFQLAAGTGSWSLAFPAANHVGDGLYEVHVRATDAAGNTEPGTTRTYRIDRAAPVTTDDAPAAYRNGPVTVTLSAADSGGSGVATTTYELDGGATQAGTSVAVPGTQGTHTITYRSTDVAGNVEADRTATVRVDTTPPTTTDDAPAGYRNGAVTVTLSAADSGGSGVAATTYELDGGATQAGTSVSVPGSEGTHTITYRSIDGAGNAEADRTATIRIDTTAPTTTDDAPGDWRDGAVTVTLMRSDEGGAGFGTTTYEVDGGTTRTGTSVVVPAATGVHTIAYRSTDAAGNVEADRTATVRVDVTDPTISLTYPSGGSLVGGVVTLTSSASDGDSGTAGVAYEYSRAGENDWRATSSSWDTAALPDGPYDVRAIASDVAGNTGTSAVVAGVQVDNRPPTVAFTAPGYVNRDSPDPLPLSATADDAGAGVATVAFEQRVGAGWSALGIDGADPFEAEWTVPADGTYVLRALATDAVGHTADEQATVVVDRTAPTAPLDDPGAFVGGTVTLTSAAADATSGVTNVAFQLSSDGAWLGADVLGNDTAAPYASVWETSDYADGAYLLRTFVTDAAGNAGATAVPREVRVDNTAPTTSDDAPAGWVNEPVTVALGAGDGAGSGVAETEYRVDGGGWEAGASVSIPAPADHANDGVHTIDYRSRDLVGNVEAIRSATVRVDTRAPATTDDAPAGWSASDVAVALDAVDDVGASGVAATEHRVDGAAWQTGATVALTVPAGQTHAFSVDYRSTDAAGNEEETRSTTVRIDKEAPTTADDAPAGWQRLPVTIGLSASDGSGSGVDSTEHRVDGGAWQPGAAVPVPTTSGVHLVEYRSTDAVGNAEATGTTSVQMDTTPPGTTDDAPSAPSSVPVTVALTPTDDHSGVSVTQYRVDGGEWQSGTSIAIPAPVDATKDYVIEYYSTDAVGNVESTRTAVVHIDTRAPSGGPVDTPSAFLRGVVALEANPADASGIVSVEFQFAPAGTTSWATIATDLTAPYAVTWDTQAAGVGELDYDLRVKVTDGAGNVAFEPLPDLPKTVDNTSATGSVTGPSGFARGTVTVTANATDAPKATGVAAVEFQVKDADDADFAPLGSDTTAPYGIAWNTSGAPDGPAELRVIVRDVAGNPATTSSVHTVTVDNSAPTVVLADPGTFARSSVTLSASGAADVASVLFRRRPAGSGGAWTPIATDTTSGDGFTATWTTVELNGHFELQAVATDASGNTGESAVRTVVVDNAAPSGAVTRPGADAIVGGGAVTLEATSSDGASGVDAVSFEYRPSGDPGAFTPIPGTTWDTLPLPSGRYELRARVRDRAGNEATTAAVTVTVDSTAPTVSLADPGASLQGTAALMATVSGSAATRVTFAVRPTVGEWLEVGSDTAAPYTVRLDTTRLPDGEYELRAVVEDSFGNTSSDVHTGVRVDNTPPSVAATTPADGAAVPSVAAITVTASEPLAAVAGVTLDGTSVAATPVGASFSVDGSGLGTGPHTLAGTLRDTGGRTAPFRLHFTVYRDAVTDVPYVEKNASPGGAATLSAADGSATVTVPAGAWHRAGLADWLVLRVDPVPAASVAASTDLLAGALVDVTARWALAGTEQHTFAEPLDIVIANTGGAAVIPATLERSGWRALRPIPASELPADWSDGFYRDGATTHVVTRHLSTFALLRDVEAPEPPGAVGVVAADGLTLRWLPGRDNSGVIRRIHLFVNGAAYATFDPTQYEVKLGPFAADDTRVFTFAQEDGAGNWSARSTPLRAVPQLVGLSLAAAQAALAERGFAVGAVRERASTAPPGTVIDPTGVQVAAQGSAVDLVVAAGPGEPPPARLVMSVLGTKRFSWATGKSIGVRLNTSRAAQVTASLIGPRGKRIYTWRLSARAGASVRRLRMPRNLRTPGRYRLVVTATSGTDVVRKTIRVEVVAGAPKRAQAAAAEVVLAASPRIRAGLARRLGTSARRIVATDDAELVFAATASPRRDVRIVVVDVDAHGLGLVRDVHVVFPTVGLVVLSSSRATLARAARLGADVALPRSAPAARIARAVRSLIARG